ncbi:hypothetical protein [Sphingomonas sp. Leaf10]|uniref:hypothetical protein n=1 Tax=Sphingomonas sp. Leaf10 TaxID=1735676 RepID=UPI0006F1ED16|nr:hypothetical protein [Sphingomonas sp. Leaf10]KQM37614.1 hypothetical protein ASE59_14110 [Sphingomonas sp. Leaf10]
MQTLPDHIAPNGATPALVDRGGVLRGASAIRVDRLGSHYKLAVTLPPLFEVDARVVVSRLIRAKRQGLRMPYPLLSIDQSLCGPAVVDGSGQSGSLLAVRGLFPNVAIREGYWLSIEDSDGQHYLHNVGANVVADGNGRAVLSVEDTMLRRPFADGCRVHLARPMIEGLVDGDEFAWGLAVDHRSEIQFTIEEAA